MCPPNTTNPSNGPPTSYENNNRINGDRLHEALIDRGFNPADRFTRDRSPDSEARQRWYLRKYQSYFDIGKPEFLFLRVLKKLWLEGEWHYEKDGREHYHTILEGHTWIVEMLSPNIDELMEAGLIRYPRINGEERKRVNRRTYYELTPSAKHILGGEWSGEGVGEEGEGLVHRLGVWITYFWFNETYCKTHNGHPRSIEMVAQRYPSHDGIELDAAVESRNISGGVWDGAYIAAEIESDSNHMSDTLGDFNKMGWACRDSIWVFPTRKILSDVVNECILRMYLKGIEEIPETLPLRNHRDTWNSRLERAELNYDFELDYKPISRVFTYQGLIDDLHDVRPDLFFDSPYGYFDVDNPGKEE